MDDDIFIFQSQNFERKTVQYWNLKAKISCSTVSSKKETIDCALHFSDISPIARTF